MMRSKQAQAALEYMTTYGWAILGVMISIGALSYFGFMNPSNLLPDKCDFGRQLECVDYQIKSDGSLNLIFRNNFGKSINITDVLWPQGTSLSEVGFSFPLTIDSGKTAEIKMNMVPQKPKGSKADIILTVNFQRSDLAGSPVHNLSGMVFVMVQ
jgi:hypothetical protein